MSALSQFTGGGAAPVGSSLLALDMPVNFTSGGAEYLRTGSIKAYAADYAAALVKAPQLRVFGTDAKTYGTTVSTSTPRYYYIGTNYFAYLAGASWQYGSALNSLGSTIASSPNTPQVKRLAVNGTSYAVCPHSSANTALWYTANGSSITAVGGTFTTMPVPSAVCFGNNSWLALSTLTATAGEQAYINNANPSGSWTVGASTNVGMTAVAAVCRAGAVFCAVGVSASATSGKIATCGAVGGAWTDRTASAGITFLASDTIEDVQYTGSALLAVVVRGSTRSLIRSTDDGVTWAQVAFPMDQSTLYPLSGAASWPGYAASSYELTTDGVGTVVLQHMGGNGRAMFAISTDHGATWGLASPYLGKAGLSGSAVRTMSYVNSRWIENHSGSFQSLVDLGTSLATPDFIGQQFNLCAGQFVRIK